jgi:hypothetical protein
MVANLLPMLWYAFVSHVARNIVVDMTSVHHCRSSLVSYALSLCRVFGLGLGYCGSLCHSIVGGSCLALSGSRHPGENHKFWLLVGK